MMCLTSYRVEVDKTKCILCGTCYSSGSIFFEPDQAGYSQVIGGQTEESRSFKMFNDDNFKLAKATAGYCPVSAILITEEAKAQREQ